MKQNLILAVAFTMVLFSTPIAAQNNDAIKAVLTNNDMAITWLGADFSHATIEDFCGCEPAQFAQQIIPSINEVVVKEASKYDFAKFLQKSDFISDITSVTKSNESIDPNAMVRTEATHKTLDKATIAKIVASYDLTGKKGVGVVLIYESLSKRNLKAIMYLTYVQMPEGKIILSKQVEGKPGGFGVRNYWAATIYSFLKEYKGEYLRSWKSEYGIN